MLIARAIFFGLAHSRQSCRREYVLILTRALVTAGLLFWPATASAQQPGQIHTDSYVAEAAEAAYLFRCQRTRTELRIVERWNRAEAEQGRHGRSVELASLAVGGRRIAPADVRRVAERLSRLAWTTSLRGRCADSGDVYIDVQGVPSAALAQAFAQDRRQVPATSLTTIQVRADGSVILR
jgi:hypothetical protein